MSASSYMVEMIDLADRDEREVGASRSVQS